MHMFYHEEQNKGDIESINGTFCSCSIFCHKWYSDQWSHTSTRTLCTILSKNNTKTNAISNHLPPNFVLFHRLATGHDNGCLWRRGDIIVANRCLYQSRGEVNPEWLSTGESSWKKYWSRFAGQTKNGTRCSVHRSKRVPLANFFGSDRYLLLLVVVVGIQSL